MTNPVRHQCANRQRKDRRCIGGKRRRGRIPQRHDGSVRKHSHSDASRSTARRFRSSPPGNSASRAPTTATSRSRRAWETRWSDRAELMVRIRKNANTLTNGRARSLRRGVRQAQQSGARAILGLPQHAQRRPTYHRRTARPASCPGIAPICSTWSASFRRSIRASRCPTGASTSLRRISSQRDFLGVSDAIGTVKFAQRQPAAILEDGRHARDQSPADFPTSQARRRIRSTRRRRWRWALNSGRSGPWKAIRTDRRTPALAAPSPASVDRREGSAVLPASLQRRSAVGEMAAPERPLRSGESRHHSITSTDKSGRATDCTTPCGRGTASPCRPTPADGAGRSDGHVALRRGAGTAAACSRLLDYHGVINACVEHGIRL